MLNPYGILLKYEELLLPKFDGGFLVILLHYKIENKEIEPFFTANDIRHCLDEIGEQFNEPVSHSERIIKNLLQYHIRNVSGNRGKYELTHHAKKLVTLLANKLNNPYKAFPLKRSFDTYFHLRINEIKSIDDLQRKFGSDFVGQHKEIINDHLEGLQEELDQAHIGLNEILHSDELSAMEMVNRFADIFRKFGERSDDISNSLTSRDHFLKSLKLVTDQFHQKVSEIKHPESIEEEIIFKKIENDWIIAATIYKDLSRFFQQVDEKIKKIRYQIIYASEKLTELQENFISQSTFRINLKRLLETALQMTFLQREETILDDRFPIKSMPFERTQLFYPSIHDFGVQSSNHVIEITRDPEYEAEQRRLIENEIKKQEKIDQWVKNCRQVLEEKKSLDFNEVFNTILVHEKDIDIAVNTGFELFEQVSKDNHYSLTIEKQALENKTDKISIWKMNIRKN